MKTETTDKIKVGVLTRSMELAPQGEEFRATIDTESRTVELAFSSETPVERYFGMEILDHSPGSVDLSRLEAGGSLFVNHDRNDIVGTIEEVRIDADRRGRARVRFGRSARAEEVFQDVIDGIRKTVSFGYRVLELSLESQDENGTKTYRVTKWQPFEISLETLPADMTVGVGRGADDEVENEVLVEGGEEARDDENPKMEENRTMKTEETTITVNEDEIRAEGVKAERNRIASIRAAAKGLEGRVPGVDELVRQFEENGQGLDAFRAAVLEKINSAEERTIEQNQGQAEIGLSKKELRRYSLVKLVRALVTNKWDEAGLELEASRAVADLVGREPNGGFVPFEALAARTTLSAGAGTGNELIATEHWADQMIGLLRNKSVLASMGARVIPGLVGDVDIPRMDSGADFAWIDNETYAGADESLPAFSSVTLSPSTLRGRVSTTRKMLKQTSPYIESVLVDDLNQGIGAAFDAAGLAGDGTGANPTGVFYLSGVSVVPIATDGGALEWEHVVDLETKVATSNADIGALGYVTNSRVKGLMKTTPRHATAAVGGYLMADDGTVNGYACGVTNNVPATFTKNSGTDLSGLAFGNWNDLLLPMWGGVDIEPDKITLADKGALILRVFLDADVKVRRVQSFSVVKDIVTT